MNGLAVGLLLLPAGILFAGENLLPNGDFETGKNNATGWEVPDGLTSFWCRDPERGRVLKLDTRPLRTQVVQWWELRKKNPEAVPPEPIIPHDELDSVAANEGTFIDSGFIPVKPGQNYKLTVDYKGKYKPFVWIKGFMIHPRRKIPVDSYQTRLEPIGAHEKEWRTYSIGFNPTARMPRTDRMKVRIYAYWQPGIYYFDRVKVEEITPEEMAVLVKKREEVQP